MTEPAARDEATPAEPVNGSKCSFAPVNRLADVSKLLRSKTAVTHSPDLFAGRKSDEVNGEINVREFLGASMMVLEGESHRRRAGRHPRGHRAARGRPADGAAAGRTRCERQARDGPCRIPRARIHPLHRPAHRPDRPGPG